MATLKDWVQGLLGVHPSQLNGKFEWHDLFSGGAIWNAISGKDLNNASPIDKIASQGTGIIESIENLIKPETSNPGTSNPGTSNVPEKSNGLIGSILNLFNETTPTIQDKTEENIETPINNNVYEFMEEQQKKQWEREDQIRAETQEREDTAYQRTVADMQAAGINPNLINISPAASGGGITSATGLDYTAYTNNLKETLTLLEQEIENTFKEDENTKDRFNQLISSLIMGLLFKK